MERHAVVVVVKQQKNRSSSGEETQKKYRQLFTFLDFSQHTNHTIQ